MCILTNTQLNTYSIPHNPNIYDPCLFLLSILPNIIKNSINKPIIQSQTFDKTNSFLLISQIHTPQFIFVSQWERLHVLTIRVLYYYPIFLLMAILRSTSVFFFLVIWLSFWKLWPVFNPDRSLDESPAPSQSPIGSKTLASSHASGVGFS